MSRETSRSAATVFAMGALGSALMLGACGGGDKSSDTASGGAPAEGAPAGGAAASGPTGDATVSGKVRFAGTLPTNPPIDMAEEPACRSKHPTAPLDSQYVSTDGGLGNVFVYVKSGLPAGATYAAPAEAVTIEQDGCEYRPRVFGVQVGQKIDIVNDDPVLHNIKAVPTKNRGFNISQPTAGMRTTRTFATEEIMVPLECNVHGWMNAYVGVTSHPFFATSKADGSFTLKNLPPGTYTIEAWHEKLGTQTTTVTVGAGETKTAEFTFGTKA
jgi:plastocyanin